ACAFDIIVRGTVSGVVVREQGVRRRPEYPAKRRNRVFEESRCARQKASHAALLRHDRSLCLEIWVLGALVFPPSSATHRHICAGREASDKHDIAVSDMMRQ